MNARLTLTIAALLVLASVGFTTAQTPAPVPAVAPVASVSPVTAPGAPQATTTPQPALRLVKPVVATTAQRTLKVVRPVVAIAPRPTANSVWDDPQAPPPPPVPGVPPQAPPQAPRAARAPQAPAPPAPPKVELPKVQATRMVKGQLVNLRLEFTITDQIGTAAPVKKTVTMNVADGESGRIRTGAEVYRAYIKGLTSVPLSIDASPEVEGGKVRLRASLEYQLLNEAASADVPSGKTSITQAVTSILNDGVSAILCQSADPLTDRKVTLEVKATIVK